MCAPPAKLAEQQIVTSNRYDGLRIGLHVYNTMDNIEAVLDALKHNLGLVLEGTAAVKN